MPKFCEISQVLTKVKMIDSASSKVMK